jgi:acyl-CoA thioester hydrolase
VQVTFPDTLTLACWVPQETIGKDRFEQLFLAVSHKDQRICADGKALMVTFDYRKGQKSLVPKAVLEALLGVIGG